MLAADVEVVDAVIIDHITLDLNNRPDLGSHGIGAIFNAVAPLCELAVELAVRFAKFPDFPQGQRH